MRPVFLTASGQPLNRWSSAFPDLVLKTDPAACLEGTVKDRLFWIDIATYPETVCAEAVTALADAGARIIALSARPEDEEAFALLSRGARGYCHAEAVPEQLREVAAVVDSGGYWMPPGLVQRLLNAATQRGADTSQPPVSDFDKLTQREYAVAVNVGRGLNNKEISEALDITERTVKAHLTAIFEKLGLRDRVQLALVVNRLPVH